DWQRAAGKGTHATLSRFEIRNMLIAAGPDFHRGETDDWPTGNIDLGPTILEILGIKATAKMDGRVLSETMMESDANAASRKDNLQLAHRRLAKGGSAEPLLSRTAETKAIEAKKDFPSGTWRQSLKISRVG